MATKKNETSEFNATDYYNEKVIVNIAPPTAEDEDKGEWVAVNSYNCYIKYGEDVEVPRFVKEYLINKKLARKAQKANRRKLEEKE